MVNERAALSHRYLAPALSFKIMIMAFLAAVLAVTPACSQHAPAALPSGGGNDREARTSVGIDPDDIIAMTDKIIADMLQLNDLMARKIPPRVIMDSKYFSNDSSNILNKDLIIDRIRINLMRISKGRIVFLARHMDDMVWEEKRRIAAGFAQDDKGGTVEAPMAADYRLGGRIKSMDRINPKSGATKRYNQITLELVDLSNSQIIWSGIYEFNEESDEIPMQYR